MRMAKQDAVGKVAQLVRERNDLPRRFVEAIDQARADGATWEQIGTAMGTTHSGAMKAYGRYRDQGEHS